jgi:hypothetical protein
MKKVLLFLLLLIPGLSMSQPQPFFDYTPSEIRQKRPNAVWNYDKWGDNNDLMSMGYDEGDAFVIYLFDENNLSVVTSIVPKTQGDLQTLVEIYNSRYVIINSKKWKFYQEGTVFLCKLLVTDSGKDFFMWTREE